MDGIIRPPILDAGCGYRSNYPEVRMGPYHTLDLTAQFHPDIVADVCKMPEVPDAQYQVVILTEVLEHIWLYEDALRECYRVLRPGGRVVITVPFWYPIHEKTYQQDYWRFTVRSLEPVLIAHGFAPVHTETAGPAMRPSNIFAYATK